MKNKSRGITLIALVITIIALLILAGVSIATLTGENGILTQSNVAKEKTEHAKEDELRKLTALEATTNIENQPYTDKNGDTITIPAGFAVSQVEGENVIKDGLVIIDKSGNEFVWVPVSQENFDVEFVRREGYRNGVLQTFLPYSGEADSTGNNTKVTETIITQTEAREMYASVKENRGFYIGRYETGKDDNENVVVKKGTEVYNVPWSANGEMQETTGTQGGAVELARNFDKINNYTSVTSTLMYGVQWDAIIKWLENIENPNSTDGLKFIQDSTNMGWYSNNYQSGNPRRQTGIDLDKNKSNCVNNVYDLAGNVREWTMESFNDYARVCRGGHTGYTGFKSAVSERSNTNPDVVDASFGFRITLYL